MSSSSSQIRGLSEILHRHFLEGIINKWYPLVLDRNFGGYFSNLTSSWDLAKDQEKMIVSQSRHLWTTSKVALFEQDTSSFKSYALHGFEYLRSFMWDNRYGGFYQIRSRDGGNTNCMGWEDEKRTSGNACAIFSLASLYGLTHDPAVLSLAKEAFEWVETHAYDTECGGYFQFLTREGDPFDETSQYRSIASDIRQVGLKDYNSTLHLLEAYTELLRVWDSDTLRSRLISLLNLVRDRIVSKKGFLQLFFGRDWTPVTFRKSSEATRALNYGLDHISFGDDLETAFLMLEASSVLAIPSDTRTLVVGKHLLDHAIENGWDNELGGFFDAGYYENGSNACKTMRSAKTWWVQAEGLNTLALYSHIYPDCVHYAELFQKQWEYIREYLIDHHNGDWYERGIDTDPSVQMAPKSHIWKCTYHTGRALMNCIALSNNENNPTIGILRHRNELDALINHSSNGRRVTHDSGVEELDTRHTQFES